VSSQGDDVLLPGLRIKGLGALDNKGARPGGCLGCAQGQGGVGVDCVATRPQGELVVYYKRKGNVHSNVRDKAS
jgi:hypothetical protein